MSAHRSDKAQMKFAVFMHGDSNYHTAGWRHPQAYADGGLNFKRWLEFAQTMERGKLDMLFIADTIGVPPADSMETLSHSSLVASVEGAAGAGAARQRGSAQVGGRRSAAMQQRAPAPWARIRACDRAHGGHACCSSRSMSAFRRPWRCGTLSRQRTM